MYEKRGTKKCTKKAIVGGVGGVRRQTLADIRRMIFLSFRNFFFLQKVVGDMSTDVGLTTAGSGIKLEERVLQMFINLHDRSLIAASIAVVGCTEDRHHIPVLAPIVTLLS